MLFWAQSLLNQVVCVVDQNMYPLPLRVVSECVAKKIYLDFCPIGQGDMKYCLLRIYLRFSRTSIARRCEETVAIYYGVPRKSVAIAWQNKIYLDFCPQGQGDMKYCLFSIYLRLSARVSHEAK